MTAATVQIQLAGPGKVHWMVWPVPDQRPTPACYEALAGGTVSYPVDDPDAVNAAAVEAESGARQAADAMGVEVVDVSHGPRARMDLVGAVEAAAIAAVSKAAVLKARERGTMPDPIPVAGSDVLVWHRSAIERWARERRSPGRPRA